MSKFHILEFHNPTPVSILSVKQNLQLQKGVYWSFRKIDTISNNFIFIEDRLIRTISISKALAKQINNSVQISNFHKHHQILQGLRQGLEK